MHVWIYISDLKQVESKVGEVVKCPENQRNQSTSAVAGPLKQRKNTKHI